MGILDELLQRTRKFERELSGGNMISEIIENNDAEIIEWNSEEQLFEKGITANGVSIATFAPYSPVTVEIKQGKGQPTDRVTLRDTGDFHNSFFLDIDKEKFEIYASDWKTRTLTDLYGEDIFGLTPDNIKDLKEYILLPELQKQARKILFKQ